MSATQAASSPSIPADQFEQTSIMPEANPDKAVKKRGFDQGFSRNMKILGVVGVIALALMALVLMRFLSSNNSANDAAVISAPGGSTQNAQGNLTPHMQAQLSERQRQEAVAAAQRGQTYIPPDATGAMMPINAANPASAPQVYQVAPVPAPQPMPAQAPVAQQTQQDTRRETQQQGLTRQLSAFLDSSNSQIRQTLTASFNNPMASASASASAAQQAQQGRLLVAGYTIHSAVLENAVRVNEGASGHASATIVSGPLKGAFLVGTAQVVNGDSLSVNFTSMRFKNMVYQIKAKLLDQQTANTAMSGDVDHRYLERWVLPIAFATAQGYFNARSQTGTTVVNIGTAVSGQTGVAQPAPTMEQARNAGYSKGMDIAGQTVSKEQQRPINVSSPIGVTIGVMFEDSVYEGSGK